MMRLCVIATVSALMAFPAEGADIPVTAPLASDGFETGDWRNFRPRYVGGADDWIRPQFTVTGDNPISGEYSLRWTSDDREHQWLMITNAFYMAAPLTVSALIRADGPEGEPFQAGLVLVEDYETTAGVHFGADGAYWQTAGAPGDTTDSAAFDWAPGAVYRLSVTFANGEASGRVTDVESGETVAAFDGAACLDPGAFAFYVHTHEDAETVIDFDDVALDTGEYRVPSDQWVRAPRFVVLPRKPDVPQEEGNWVGGQSVLKLDGEYLMWYRIRDNERRGAGYGFARSSDGVTWEKHEDNPIFTHAEEHSSNEKISVLHVDGVFRAWYTVDVDAPGWRVIHAESEDGVEWTNHQMVLEDTPCKDPAVLYVDGTYYLYAISPGNTDIGVYTSPDGLDWTQERYYPMGAHRHVKAYYVPETEQFWLYGTAGGQGVSRAVSDDGINFGPFKQTWIHSKAGLDDWEEAGVTYFSFPRNGHGHIPHDDNVVAYYQARNTYANNIPGWLYHGGERVVMAGWFSGLHVGVPAWVQPDGSLEYELFPYETPPARGIAVHAPRPTRVVLEAWEEEDGPLAQGAVDGSANTQVQWALTERPGGGAYRLEIGGETVDEQTALPDGSVTLTAVLDGGEQNFAIHEE